jgi:small-conductance mechanosensitive channel
VLLAKAVSKIVTHIFELIGADKLADKLNEIELLSSYNLTIKPSRIIAKITYYLILLIFLIAATELLGMPAVSQLISDLINYVPNLISAIIVLIFGLFIADTIKGIVLTTCKSFNLPSSGLIANFAFYFIFITAVISALSQAKVDTDFIKNNLTMIMGGGVAAFALGYGLASRDLMANFLSSFYSRAKFNVGDYIQIGDTEGVIIEIDNSSLTLETQDSQVVIPLSMLVKEKVSIKKNNFLREED